MTPLCDRLHEFIDGELPRDERAAFFTHLDECPACSRQVDELLMLDAAMEDAMVKGQSTRHSKRHLGRIQLRTPGVWLGVGALAAAAIAIFVIRPWTARERPVELARLDKRPIEFRVGPPEMDVHAPYDPQLGASHGSGQSYRELAELERRGRRVLAASLLQRGDLKAAGAVLEQARDDTSLENERAVLALMEGRPQDALAHLPDLPASPSSQALWNRGLALRDLHLPHAAAQVFDAVASRGEGGWSSEAANKARSLVAQAARWEKQYEDVLGEGRALISEQKAPSAATLAGQRDFVRLFFYDAVRSAGTSEELKRLRPIAGALDQSYGGEQLGRYLIRIAATDLSRRRPLATQYRAYAEARWRNLDAEPFKAFLAQARKAGTRDILVGALLASRAALDDTGEFVRLARAEKDPWLDLAADELRAQDPGLPLPERETLLRQSIERATKEKLDLRRMRLEKLLVELLIHQHRSHEALPLLSDLRARARRQDDLTMERLAVWKLVLVSHFRHQRSLLKAYASEVLLWSDYPCVNRREVVTTLAQDALLSGELEAAREQLKAIPSCGDKPAADYGIAWLYSELARAGGPADLEALRAYLALRGKDDVPADQIALRVFEYRALLNVEPRASRDLLAEIGKLEALPDDDQDRDKGLLIGYQALALRAVDDAQYELAFHYLARERKTPLPAGCVVGLLAEEAGRIGIVLRDASGGWTGTALPRRNSFKDVIPANLRGRLAGCPEVAVIAEPPFHSQADLLEEGLVWSFHEGGQLPGASRPSFAHHVAISDVEPPSSLHLDPLPTWTPPERPPIAVHLVGAAATPARTLSSIADADLVQFHTHGLLDAGVADAAFLALSPGEDGVYALTAGQIRRTKLVRHPIVILAACDAADIDVNYNPAWSLPMAFIKSGARAVFAASAKLPSQGSREFFGDLLARLQAGTRPAAALRDLRLRWREQGATWANQVLLFE